jgi:hypothetical protein
MPSAMDTTMDIDPTMPDETRGPIVLALTLWMLGFSTAFVVTRIVSRLGIVKRWSWDDSFMIVAWVRIATAESYTYISFLKKRPKRNPKVGASADRMSRRY